MKRVAMVIQRYLPHVGGAEKQLQQLAPRLKNQGYEVHVLTRHERGLKRFETIDGVPVHRLPAPGPKPVAAAAFTISALWTLVRLRPDIVHAHEILTPASIAILSKRWIHRPVLVKILRGGARGDEGQGDQEQRPTGARGFRAVRLHPDACSALPHRATPPSSRVGSSL